MIGHTFNQSIWKAKAERSQNLRPNLSTDRVPEQPMSGCEENYLKQESSVDVTE